MRDVPPIWETWRSGAYVGDARPCTRVTVETSYLLRTTEPVLGQWTRGPARWFQRQNTDRQIETEIPNVLHVSINRALSSDAGSCDISIANIAMPDYGDAEIVRGQFGDTGYFTWDHGSAQDARSRWGHRTNPWSNVLVPNALLRTYTGFGGHDKSLAQAQIDGNLVLYGVWLVDDVQVSTDGTIQIRCRDMAKILIDQGLYPPLVPKALHPVRYNRWRTEIFKIADPLPPTGSFCYQATYVASSTDVAYGETNTQRTGHPPGEAFDISTDPPNSGPGEIAHQRTYWMSEPKAGAGDHVWIEFGVDAAHAGSVNLIYYHAWGGNYTIQVSVWENGQWVAPEAGGQGGMTADGVPFVHVFSPVWEGGQPPGLHPNTYPLPRDYHGTKIRLTISNLIKAPEGGFRAGARKIMACFDQAAASYPRYTFAGASMPSTGPDSVGYWQARSDGRVFAFGDARLFEPTSPATTHASAVIAMTAHSTANGYWTVDMAGRVLSYGQAEHYGDLFGVAEDVVDIARTPSGDGYWLLRKNGSVHAYGDATSHGDATVTGTMPSGAPIIARSIESHPTIPGYWVLCSDGVVQAFDLTHLGNAARSGFDVSIYGRAAFDAAEYVASIRRTHTGDGYWIPSGGGIVQGFGDAFLRGHVPKGVPEQWSRRLCWDVIPSTIDDTGLAVVRADGNLSAMGNWSPYGSIGEGAGERRLTGNYTDYTQIVRDLLLWAGFYFYPDTVPAAEMPEVYGNLEPTGAYAKLDLPLGMFDKKPVIEAIKDLKKVVGYVFRIDPEGGAVWASPNWWTMGNFLIDGTPFDYMPEIDETVQMISHGVTFSAQAARSSITIATVDPLPAIAGAPDPTGVVITTLNDPASAKDLRGMISPLVWWNGLFLNPTEQRIMADQLDMQIWFQRRVAQVSCVANPLIDIDDQVRIFERQTGEAYCVDDETEILTQRGWLSLEQVKEGDKTLSLNPETHQSEWVRIAGVYRDFREGERVLGLEGKRHSSRSTLDHKWYVNRLGPDGNETWRWETSATLNSRSRIPRAAVMMTYPERTFSDAFVRLIAWYATEGCMRIPGKKERSDDERRLKRAASITQCAKANPAHCASIEAALEEEGVRFNRHRRANGKTLYRVDRLFAEKIEAVTVMKAPTMEFLLALSEPQLRIFIETCIDGDGHRQDSCDRFLQRPGPTSDAFQVACSLAGIPFGVKVHDGMDVVTLSKEPFVRPMAHPNLPSGKTAVVESHTGWVWCPTLERNHIWLARRRGSVYYTGNCHYVTGINFSHDLMSGDYTMNLSTHWMGGTPWGKQAFFFAGADRPDGAGYFQVNAFGSVYAYGTAETYTDHESDSHLDWVIGLRSTPSGAGYYSVDTSGKILTYGDAVHRGELYRSAKDVVDMALTPTGFGYWLLRKDGTVTGFGDATHHGDATVTFIDAPATTAVSIEAHPSTSGYWVLLADGEVQAFDLAHHGDFNWTGYDIREAAVRLRRSSGGNGYWICSNTGGVQAFGAAPDRGGHRSYPAGLDSDRLSTDLIVDEITNGYALQHADGSLTTFGFTNLGQSSEVHVPGHTVWPIVTATTYAGLDHPEDLLPVSLELMSFLQKTGSKSANNAVANNFGTPTDPTVKAF